MGQRVNIQYSIDIDDIENEVNSLFARCLRQLEPMGRGNSFDSVPIDLSGIEYIDGIRRKMAKVDIALGDIQNIIEGYVRFKTQTPEPPTREREIPFQQTSEELEIEQLQDKIEMFRRALDENSNKESQKQDE